MIAHLVLFTPKTHLTNGDIRLFAQSLAQTLGSMTQISRSIVGRRVDIDPGYHRSMGHETYEFAAVLEFKDRASLVAYLGDPRHQELGRLFWEMCEKTIVSEIEFRDGRDPDLTQFLLN